MNVKKISWRDALKRWSFLRCRGCAADDDGRDWYVVNEEGPYCEECTVKLQYKDPTRSATQFFQTTRG